MYDHRLFIRYASSTARSHKYLLSQSHFRVQCMQMCRHGQDDLLEFKQNEGFSPSPMFTETALKKIKHPVSSWTKMTSWHQSSEENAQTAAEEHLWMDRTLKLEADGLLQHWVPLLYEKLRLQSSQDQRNQTAEDCKTVVWFWYAMEI